jgi:hypothetical protein
MFLFKLKIIYDVYYFILDSFTDTYVDFGMFVIISIVPIFGMLVYIIFNSNKKTA